MAWTHVLAFLTMGGCMAGFFSTVNGAKSNKNFEDLPVLAKTEREIKKIQFLERIKDSLECQPSKEEQFGTVYFCLDSSLYYLEEESNFDWTESIDNLMPLFKKVKKFHYKDEGASKSYLWIDLEDGKENKKVLLDDSDSGDDWASYNGYQGTL